MKVLLWFGNGRICCAMCKCYGMMSISLKYHVTSQKCHATKMSRDNSVVVLVVYLEGGVSCSLLFCRALGEENRTQLRKHGTG